MVGKGNGDGSVRGGSWMVLAGAAASVASEVRVAAEFVRGSTSSASGWTIHQTSIVIAMTKDVAATTAQSKGRSIQKGARDGVNVG